MDPNLILYPGDVYLQCGGRHYKHIEKVLKNNKKRNTIIIYNKHHPGKINDDFNGTVKEFLDLARENAKKRRIAFVGDTVLYEEIDIEYHGKDSYLLDYGYAYDEPWKTYDLVRDKEDGIEYEVMFSFRAPFGHDIDQYSPSAILDLPISEICKSDTEFRYEFIRLDDKYRIPEWTLYAREVTLVKRKEER